MLLARSATEAVVDRAKFGVLGAGVAAATVTAVADPNKGHFPLCPLKAVTGLDCPACGSLRAFHSLAHGQLHQALDHNVLFVLGFPLLVYGWLVMGGVLPRPRPMPRPLVWAGVALLAVFMVVRNLPGSWLGSGAA
jgi:hypothetical protein